MTTTKSLSLIFIAYIISICICQQGGNNGGGGPGGPNGPNVYTGSIALLQDQFNNPRSFATVTIDYNNDRVEIIYEGKQ